MILKRFFYFVTGYIYKLTLLQDTASFKKGEVYIGQHLPSADKHYFSSGKLIERLVKKYSKKIFKKEVLQRKVFVDLIDWLEIYWIFFYNCNRNRSGVGLNLTDGGKGALGYNHTKENKKKMSVIRKGKKPWNTGLKIPMSLKRKAKHTLLMKQLHRGKIVTKQTKDLFVLSNIKTGRIKPVIQLTLDNIFIKEFSSARGRY